MSEEEFKAKIDDDETEEVAPVVSEKDTSTTTKTGEPIKTESEPEPEPEPSNATTTTTTTDTKAVGSESAPPAKPARPLSPAALAIKNLQDAFPGIDEKYVKMALIASEGKLDPAFNALLYLSDPTSDIAIPTPEVKPKLPSRDSFEKRKQLESDEALAKRLAREYERRASSSSAGTGAPHSSSSTRSQHRQPPPKPSRKPQWDRDNSDSEDDDIVESIVKNVEETGNKIGGWFGNIAKKIQTEVNGNQNKNQLFSAFGSNNNSNDSNSNNNSSISNPRPNYNRRQQYEPNESELAGSEVGGIRLNDESENDIYGTPKRESFDRKKTLPSTPAARDSTSTDPSSTPAVTLGAAKESAAKESSAKESASESTSADARNKWEPLSTVAPEPINDDTFLVDDSEDEEEAPIEATSKSAKD